MKSIFYGHCPKCNKKTLKNPLLFFKGHGCKKCNAEIYLEPNYHILNMGIFFLWFVMNNLVFDLLELQYSFYVRGAIMALSILPIIVFFSFMVFGKYKKLRIKSEFYTRVDYKAKIAILLTLYIALFFLVEWIGTLFKS